jgi:competence protein ComEC
VQRRLALCLVLIGWAMPGSAQDRVVPSNRVTHFVHVRAAPTTASDSVRQLLVGSSLPLVGSVPLWYEVELPDGTSAFVSKAWTTVVRALAARQQDEMRLHFLNVGAGTCTIVECPGPDAPPLIVDCGSSGGTEHGLTREQTAAYVHKVLSQHATAPNVVLSHGDSDHYAYMPSVLPTATAQHIWQGGEAADYGSHGFPAWVAAQEQNGAHLHRDFPAHWHNDREPIGEHLSCGLAEAFVLTVGTGTNKNAQSLVLMLEYDDFTAVLTGDAEGSTEARVSTHYEDTIQATVLTTSHHGASTASSNSQAWATAVAPTVLVSSAGRRFGHPRCTAVARFVATLAPTLGHPVWCGVNNDTWTSSRTARAEYVTEVNGTIIVTTNGRSPLWLHCTRSAECGVPIPFE